MTTEEFVSMLESLDRLDIDSTFMFECDRCGECCFGRDDILLNAFDVHRIAKFFNKSPEEFIVEYCDVYLGPQSKVPIVRLKPQGEDQPCLFLEPDMKYAVDEVKPTICRNYPLGLVHCAGEDPEVRIIKQPVTCGGSKEQLVKDWLIPGSMENFSRWHTSVSKVSVASRSCDWEKTDAFKAIMCVMLDFLYVMDTDGLEERADRIVEFFDKGGRADE